ncbi:MAG TPA: sugar ABC transporter permease, partial [Actinomycetota bacterium]|nr:sugar ABC transporter permease [Actinomycetota bacterium]
MTQVAGATATGMRGARGVTLAGVLRWLGPMGPAIAVLALFFMGPILWTFYMAFTNTSLTGVGASHSTFIGLQNFSRMLQDSTFRQAVVLTLIFVGGSAV